MQIRETAMRHAFSDAIYKVLNAPVVKQPRLVQRVARIVDAGSGLRKQRAKQ